jgi:hypothetical protein
MHCEIEVHNVAYQEVMYQQPGGGGLFPDCATINPQDTRAHGRLTGVGQRGGPHINHVAATKEKKNAQWLIDELLTDECKLHMSVR